MAALVFDIQRPEVLLHDLEQANRRLAKERAVPESIIQFISDVCEQIGESGPEEPEGVAPNDWMAVQSAALRALAAARHDEDEVRQRRQLRVLIEELRFRLARLAERQWVADDRPVKDVVRWLDRLLTISQAAKGELFGVSDRTWQRWASETETAHPTGDDERQVRLVARVVAELRHLLTANGVVDWLANAEPALGGRSPRQVVRDGEPERLKTLFALAAASRAGAAG